jgi:ABC-type dipeptide/oligopeptide/nickel transport system permease component
MADVLSMVVANAGVSMPVFWLGLMLAYFFGVTMKDTPFWLPPSGRSSPDLEIVPFYEDWNLEVDSKNPPRGLEFVANIYTLNAVLMTDGEQLSDALRHLILPSIALGTIPMSIIARITRSSLLEVLGLQYVRTARAKGLRELTVVMRHALRNALLPVVTIIGLWMGSLVGGAILTETIFGFSGVGRIMYDSITARDYTVIQGFTLVIAVAFVFVNLIVDLLYSVLDPRIRLK